MGEHRERMLAGQLGSLEAEPDRQRARAVAAESKIEVLEAEKSALQNAVRQACGEADGLRDEMP